ncbi:glycosyltransferase family 2 protein [Oceanirhabdus sp. W0125-5]|uniref:glycosyltransferase family 2 protein n=1 Tax=Oceanirhabdus sp. W0125-5 TaxID=2999116 RepID=UPI0022F2A7D8|nr:glycosyltransferase family 2 protein [Oceanirhabdus sp. W0125-5]WBW98607.1 glycosyltransferase family 2 protein [Oceanirhabdus sp. W0125-5]
MIKELLIMIPAYNEEESIEGVLNKIYEAGINEIGDILVINDGSKDNTEKVVREFKVPIINQVCNMGYGSALQVGYKYAEKKGYEYVIQLDADGQHDISNIKTIYDCLKNKNLMFTETPDIVIGSRFLSDSSTFKTSKLKNIAISFFRVLIKIFTKNDITDPTSGLQGLNRRAFTYYAGYGNFDYKYPDINMIIQMIMQGYNIKEIPAVMHERENGESMHSGLIKPIKYMVIMILSTFNIILRNRKSPHGIGKERV